MKSKLMLVVALFTLTSGVWVVASGIEAATGWQKNPDKKAKIWDAMKKYEEKLYTFQKMAWPDRAEWKQVPYGTTDYEFVGDVVIENGNFWLFINSTPDNPFLYPNVEERPGFCSELYTSGVGFNQFPLYTKILRNTPDEVIVEHAGTQDRARKKPPAIVKYRIKKGGGWVEVIPVKNAAKQSHHSSPNRFAVVPPNNGVGNDFVVDPVYDAPELGKGIKHYLPSDNNTMMIQEVCWSYHDGCMYTLTYPDPIIAKPYIATARESKYPNIYRLETMTALFGGKKIVLGVVNQKNVFKRRDVNQHIDAGDTYTYSFSPPIPGRWRMSGRVDGKYYTSDVYDGNFTFTSPVSGTLEVLVVYLYDRTAETPADVNTPMDIYRETIGGEPERGVR